MVLPGDRRRLQPLLAGRHDRADRGLSEATLIVSLTRKAHFCAGHRYWRDDWTPERNTEVFGPCANPHGHGHNYTIEVTVAGEVDDDTGMLINLTELDAAIRIHITDQLDHHNLNADVPGFAEKVPTTENLALWCFERMASALPEFHVQRVTIRESDDLWATVEAD